MIIPYHNYINTNFWSQTTSHHFNLLICYPSGYEITSKTITVSFLAPFSLRIFNNWIYIQNRSSVADFKKTSSEYAAGSALSGGSSTHPHQPGSLPFEVYYESLSFKKNIVSITFVIDYYTDCSVITRLKVNSS